jgi:NhaP-type Na+/H+ or K+/H+ antiporter
MFETSETTDVLEPSPWQKYALWLAAGCIVTSVIFGLFVIPAVKHAAAESARKAAQQKFLAELAKARFDRQTILYDNSIITEPGRIWIIPDDVEPIAVGDHAVSYTYYDPKTKRETVHFHPPRQSSAGVTH